MAALFGSGGVGRVVVALVAASTLAVSACGAADTDRTPPVVGDDHWHAAFGVWLCDRYLDAFVDRHGDRHGIHSHDDGLIHIHPSDRSAAGERATLAVFGDEVDVRVAGGVLQLPDGRTFRDGDQCEGGPGRLRVLRWAPTPTGDATAESLGPDLAAVPLRDRDALAIVFAPVATEVPPPWGVYALDALADVLAGVDERGPTADAAAGARRGPLATIPQPSTTSASSSTTTGRASTAIEPTGTRASFAIWLAEVSGPDASGGCTAPDVPAWSGGVCYRAVDATPRLGPEILERSTATRRDATGEWTVDLVFTPTGLERFNELVGQAWTRRSPLAVEFGGRVLTAPTVQTQRFERDDVVSIAAQLTEQSASRLATTLDRP